MSLRHIDLSWQDQALCADELDPDSAFYGDHILRRTRRLCRRCPVQAECLEYALVTDERWGVWGGADTTERKELGKLIGTITPRQAADRYVATGDTTWAEAS